MSKLRSLKVTLLSALAFVSFEEAAKKNPRVQTDAESKLLRYLESTWLGGGAKAKAK